MMAFDDSIYVLLMGSTGSLLNVQFLPASSQDEMVKHRSRHSRQLALHRSREVNQHRPRSLTRSHPRSGPAAAAAPLRRSSSEVEPSRRPRESHSV